MHLTHKLQLLVAEWRDSAAAIRLAKDQAVRRHYELDNAYKKLRNAPPPIGIYIASKHAASFQTVRQGLQSVEKELNAYLEACERRDELIRARNHRLATIWRPRAAQRRTHSNRPHPNQG